jgi:tRNA dimethylallyltransferase
VLGPTAAGKSEVALQIAEALDADLLSVDSMQVYRGMDIGTAKPSAREQARVRHHMIDLVDPSADYTAGDFQRDGRNALDELAAAGRNVVIAGGSGLHFRAVVDPLEFPPSDRAVRARIDELADGAAVAHLTEADPEAGTVVDLQNPRRVARALEVLELTGLTPSRRAAAPEAAAVRDYVARYEFVGLGIDPGDELGERISGRLTRMMEVGFLDEVASLADRMGRNAAQAVGYRQLLPVVRGVLDVEEGVAEADRATKALAKRQRTFFGRDPRITWLPWHDDAEERVRAVLRVVEEHS